MKKLFNNNINLGNITLVLVVTFVVFLGFGSVEKTSADVPAAPANTVMCIYASTASSICLSSVGYYCGFSCGASTYYYSSSGAGVYTVTQHCAQYSCTNGVEPSFAADGQNLGGYPASVAPYNVPTTTLAAYLYPQINSFPPCTTIGCNTGKSCIRQGGVAGTLHLLASYDYSNAYAYYGHYDHNYGCY